MVVNADAATDIRLELIVRLAGSADKSVALSDGVETT